MSLENRTTINEAAKLIRLAMNPRETVARSSEYQLLLQAYHRDADFREAVDLIANGLNLQVIELARDVGLTVVNILDGPYAPKLQDFRANMKPRERIVFGLLMAMLAGFVYPTRRSLGEIDDSTVVSIELTPLVEWASRVARQLRDLSEGKGVASDDLRTGFETIAVMEPFGESNATLESRFRVVLEWLHEHGLFLRREESGRELWVARPHYRVQVRHMMQSSHSQLLELVSNARASELN